MALFRIPNIQGGRKNEFFLVYETYEFFPAKSEVEKWRCRAVSTYLGKVANRTITDNKLPLWDDPTVKRPAAHTLSDTRISRGPR